MSADTVFSICSTLIIPGWLLLVLLPRWKWTLGLIATGLIPFILAVVYGSLFLFGGEAAEGGNLGSLAGVTILFSNPYSLTAGWIHFLAFDLFIGAWEVKDSQDKNIPHWMVIPCLGLTLMLGPVGLALYLIIRTVRTRGALIYT